MQVPLTFFGTNVEHQPQIRGIHYSVRSPSVSQISIELQEIYQLLEMEAPKKKGKVRWLLHNEQYIFEMKDVEVGIIRPLVEIMLIIYPQTHKEPYVSSDIATAIYHCFFKANKSLGIQDSSFLAQMSPEFICLIATVL